MKSVVLSACVAVAMHASSLSTYAPKGVVGLYRTDHQFVVEDRSGFKPVADHFVDKRLLAATPVALQKLQECGYLKLSTLSNGEYKLDYAARGRGGGPFSATVGYWTVKILGYGLMFGAYRRAAEHIPAGPVRTVVDHGLDFAQEAATNTPALNIMTETIGAHTDRIVEHILRDDTVVQDVMAVNIGMEVAGRGGLGLFIDKAADVVYYALLNSPLP